MTPDQLPPGTKERIEKDAKKKYPERWGEIETTIAKVDLDNRSSYIAGATAEAARYIPLLRFANCPEFLIENPALINGKKPTDEDMQWALEKVQEFKTYEQSMRDKYAPAIEALERLVKLKQHKDRFGKDDYYEHAQPLAWEAANTVLNNLNQK